MSQKELEADVDIYLEETETIIFCFPSVKETDDESPLIKRT